MSGPLFLEPPCAHQVLCRLAMLAAIPRFVFAPAGFLLAINVCQPLAGAIVHDEAGVQFLD